MEWPDHYRSLGVAPTATHMEIFEAYRAKAAKSHPDVGGDPFSWQTVQKAYDTLIDDASRLQYDQGEDDTWDDEDELEGEADDLNEPWERCLEPFDLLAALGVRCDGDHVSGGMNRCRACFYKLATYSKPFAPDRYNDADEYANAVIRYRQICFAFRVLIDPARWDIYQRLGFSALKASEGYQEQSLFELEAQQIADHFFSGTDLADREFLLLNGADAADDGFDGERLAPGGRGGLSMNGKGVSGSDGDLRSSGDAGDEEEESASGDDDADADADLYDCEAVDALAAAATAAEVEAAAGRARAADDLRLRPPPPPPVPIDAGGRLHTLGGHDGQGVAWKEEEEEGMQAPIAWPEIPEMGLATKGDQAPVRKSCGGGIGKSNGAIHGSSRLRSLLSESQSSSQRSSRRVGMQMKARRRPRACWWHRFFWSRRWESQSVLDVSSSLKRYSCKVR